MAGPIPKTKVSDRVKFAAFRQYLIARERWRTWTR